MTFALHKSPTELIRSSTEPVTSKDVLMSCKTIQELERLSTQYTMITDLLRGLPEDPCDEVTAAKIKLELIEIEAALQTLDISTTEAEELKADLEAMMEYVKEHRLHENIDNYLLNRIMRQSIYTAPQKPCIATPNVNKKSIIEESHRPQQVCEGRKTIHFGIDEECVGKQEVAFRELDENDRNRNVGLKSDSPQKKKRVSDDEFLSVPEHIRGRLKIDKINETVELLWDVTRLKYLLLRKRKGLTPLEREAIARMRSEIVPGVRECRFITEEDIYFFQQKKLPRSTLNHLTILRYLQKIREVRDRNIVRIVLKE